MSTTYEDIITALAGFITTQEVDYKVGEKEFRNSQKVDQLVKMAELELKYPVGDIHTVIFDNNDVDEFGIDRTQRAVPTN